MPNQIQEPARFRSQEYLDVLDAAPSASTIHLPSASAEIMRKEAAAGHPLEVCGLLVGRLMDGDWHIREAIPVPNLNSERAVDRFQLDPRAFQEVDNRLRNSDDDIVGIYHSHPDCPARPSPTDLENAWDDYAYIIVSVSDSGVQDLLCWQVNPDSRRFAAVTVDED